MLDVLLGLCVQLLLGANIILSLVLVLADGLERNYRDLLGCH